MKTNLVKKLALILAPTALTAGLVTGMVVHGVSARDDNKRAEGVVKELMQDIQYNINRLDSLNFYTDAKDNNIVVFNTSFVTGNEWLYAIENSYMVKYNLNYEDYFKLTYNMQKSTMLSNLSDEQLDEICHIIQNYEPVSVEETKGKYTTKSLEK